ncbi:tyrosine-type recombinase/integrase [Streptomyces sp. NPDC058409]|uniref:tyrosine-type recombinase/integrase n=1 Tax=Streptomyces sp. NPDC058409 TaxID=3346484 RepID=UPI0036484042
MLSRSGAEHLPGTPRSRRWPRSAGADGRAHAPVRRRPAATRAGRSRLAGGQRRPWQAVDRDREHPTACFPPHPAAPARGPGVGRGRTPRPRPGLHRRHARPGRTVSRSRQPFADGVARALADETKLLRLAGAYDPFDRGLRDAWETIIVTGRRCGEILQLRLECLGRYGGLPMLWHDQTKVGNYDQALRIPERVDQLLEARQRKTLTLFEARNNRPPTAEERTRMALFPTNIRNRDGRRPLSYKWFHKGFKLWIDELDIGRWVPHQARHSLATSLLRAGATLTHVRRYLGHVSERMAEHYINT